MRRRIVACCLSPRRRDPPKRVPVKHVDPCRYYVDAVETTGVIESARDRAGWAGGACVATGAVVATGWKQNVVTLEVAVLVELIP